MDMQAMVDTLSKGWRAERALSQMTLGVLIKELTTLPKETKIVDLIEPHSYRGYYSDLSFEGFGDVVNVATLINKLKTKCLDKTFGGYKGGDFVMDKDTPLWLANYGCCGLKIVGIKKSGKKYIFLTAKDDTL